MDTTKSQVLYCTSTEHDDNWRICYTADNMTDAFFNDPNKITFAEKDLCVDFCNGVYGGAQLRTAMDCMRQNCLDGEEATVQEWNEKLFMGGVKMYADICSSMGYTEVVKDATKTSTEKSKPATKTEDSDKTETTESTEAKSTDTDAKPTSSATDSKTGEESSKEEGSGAIRMSLGGWKGTLVLLGLVIGSLVSGL
ncbi:hypothetical protein BJ508DRAFT_331632 [Ascobolus immersus RN42]|uniref:Uncharacterized protein n=1 Tax=Ascobolus immersus RN42 TaxID=1160509 RepID=A0A3N4HRK2_ASCIM|nr:hypothetical protein BJ508DRAFT_331632 [Ascobolus immersus RN42]